MAAQDLTKGSIGKWVLRLAWPTLVAFLLQNLYTLADLFFLGKLGAKVLAAFAISFNSFFLVLALASIFGVGSLAQMAQHYGAGNIKAVKQVFPQTVLLVVVVGGICWLLAALAAPWYFDFFTDDAAVVALGVPFYRIYSSALLLQVLLFSLGHCWRAVGDFRTPMRLMSFSVCLNLLLDPLLIFGWGPVRGLGMNGAAWATLISQGAANAIYLWLSIRHDDSAAGDDMHPLGLQLPLYPDWAQMANTLRIGFPAGVQYLFVALGMMATYAWLRPLGSLAIAAAGVGFRLFETGILPIVSVGIGVASLVGQNRGAGEILRARAAFWWGLRYSLLMALFGCVLAWSAPYFWLGLFTDNPQLLPLGVAYLNIHVLALPVFAWVFSVNAVSIGLGRTDLSLASELMRIVILLSWLIGSWMLLGSNLLAIFWTNNIAGFFQALFVCWVLYYLWKGPLKLPANPLPTSSL